MVNDEWWEVVVKIRYSAFGISLAIQMRSLFQEILNDEF